MRAAGARKCDTLVTLLIALEDRLNGCGSQKDLTRNLGFSEINCSPSLIEPRNHGDNLWFLTLFESIGIRGARRAMVNAVRIMG